MKLVVCRSDSPPSTGRSHHTFPVVRSWSPKQYEVVVGGETDRHSLLTKAKLFVSLRSTLTKLPLPSVQVVSLRQVLAQDVAASNGVSCLRGLTHTVPELIQVSTSLEEEPVFV